MRLSPSLVAVCTLLGWLLAGCRSPQPEVGASPAADRWELVWQDGFDANGLPASDRWTYDVGGHGWGNGELQYYTAARAENAEVRDGRLHIVARKEAWDGNAFTSARLVSRGLGDFRYGRFEIRAKIPAARGTWSAIWMMPESSSATISNATSSSCG